MMLTSGGVCVTTTCSMDDTWWLLAMTLVLLADRVVCILVVFAVGAWCYWCKFIILLLVAAMAMCTPETVLEIEDAGVGSDPTSLLFPATSGPTFDARTYSSARWNHRDQKHYTWGTRVRVSLPTLRESTPPAGLSPGRGNLIPLQSEREKHIIYRR